MIKRKYQVRVIKLSLILFLLVIWAMWFYMQIELRLPSVSWITDPDVDTWFLTIELYAPASIWGQLLKVEGASFNSIFFSSVDAWRTEPEVDEVMFPFPDDRSERFAEAVKEPLKGSSAPTRILMEIHRTKPFTGWDNDYSTVTVTYRYFGIKRQLAISREGRSPKPYRVGNRKGSSR